MDGSSLTAPYALGEIVVIPGFYTPEETEALNAHIDRFIAETLPGLPSDAAFYEVNTPP